MSENGWEPSWASQDMLVWKQIPGAKASMQFLKGFPSTILTAFAADYNAYVEPLHDHDCCSYTPTNSVPTSNHLNGTGMDMRWQSHPFQVKGTFTAPQMKTIRELLDFYEGTVFWAGDWKSPIDEMHWQMGYGTYQDQAHLRDFVSRKIRVDGCSTFRRGNGVEAPPKSDQSQVLADATGISLEHARKILPTLQQGLTLSECNTVNRIAMWLAQVGHESDGFQATEEYAKNGRYAPYIGRTWIQITWDYNYRAFGEWCFSKGLVSHGEKFLDSPNSLADMKWAGIGPAWYWTVERPQINSLCDQGNLLEVTRAINGGTNGLADRNARFKRARDLGDRLLILIQGDDDMFSDEDRALLRQLAEIKRPSLSPLRHLGEGPVNTPAGFSQSSDGLTHPQFVLMAAKLGDRDSIKLLAEVADADPVKYPDRQADAAMARAMLVEVASTNPTALQQFLNRS